MGALHRGHESLVEQACGEANALGLAAGCVVSIFVNPTQFNDPKDFARYPRTLEDDIERCTRSGASAIFAPSPEVMYPVGRTVRTPPLPRVASGPGLEDAHRPGHFAGVCQVVLRLFEVIQPAAAVFGEKDWQQLQTVRAMTNVEMPSVRIVPGSTVREADGLAMSSRNRFLSPPERARAAAISRALREAGRESTPTDAEVRMRRVLADAQITPEYAVVRDAQTLGPHDVSSGRPARALIAAPVGSVRLIDNAPWPGS